MSQAIKYKDIRVELADARAVLEAKRFWACIMFLDIMPPKEHKNGLLKPKWNCTIEWRNIDGETKHLTYTAQSRYEEFVASHATCCEHITQYFIFYHRNLMAKYNLALQEADYFLRKYYYEVNGYPKNETESLLDPEFQWVINEINDKVVQNGLEAQRNQALTEYHDLVESIKDLEGSLPWVTPFYWNVFDFKNKVDIPQFFAYEGQKTGQALWLPAQRRFFETYKKFKFGSLNYAETWYKEQPFMPTPPGYEEPIQLDTEYYRNILEGTKDESKFKITTKQEYYEDGALGNVNKSSKSKVYAARGADTPENPTDHITPMSLIPNLWSNFVYGGQGCEFIPKSEYSSFTTEGYVEDYNYNIPYYKFAEAIQLGGIDYSGNRNSGCYLIGNPSLTSPHNIGHNNHGQFLIDDNFSIRSPLFMLYHGFIEWTHESFLRETKRNGELEKAKNSLLEFVNGNIDEIVSGAGQDPYDILLFIQKVLRNPDYNHDYHPDLSTIPRNGDYPLFEWISPEREVEGVRDNYSENLKYVSHCQYEHIMMTDNLAEIRFSDNIHSLYQKQIDADQIWIPQELKSYPFNYTFDLFDAPDADETGATSYYPDYVLEVKNDIEVNVLKSYARLASRTRKEQHIVQKNQKKNLRRDNSELRQDISIPKVPRDVLDEIERNLILFYKKDILKGIGPSKFSKFKDHPEFIIAETKQNLQKVNQMIQKAHEFHAKVKKSNVIYGRLEYPADLPNGNYNIGIAFKNIHESRFFNSINCTNSGKLGNRILNSQKFFHLSNNPVFGKGNMAIGCPRCKDSKVFTLDFSDELSGSNYPLLFDLHANLNLGVVYDSTGTHPLEKDITHFIKGVTHHEKQGFVFNILSGARAATFNFFYCENFDRKSYYLMPDNNDFEVIIIGHTRDVSNHPHKNTASLKATRKSLKAPIHFEELDNPKSHNRTKRQLDLVYSSFKIFLTIKRAPYNVRHLIKEISFDVTNYHENVSYDVLINEDSERDTVRYDFMVRNSNASDTNEIFF